MGGGRDFAETDAIYGDDLSPQQIEAWFREEENGYASLGYVDSETDTYPYHGMNRRYGWRYLPERGRNLQVLGLGSSFASEFEPLVDQIGSITVIEPGRKFWRSEKFGRPISYLMPEVSGNISFSKDSFDLVTAFGVLHHIPNVSHVLRELIRVTKPGGYLLIREPIISMGDWSRPRPGLTKNERGIPLAAMRRILSDSGCEIVSEQLIGFSPLLKFVEKVIPTGYWNNEFLLTLDFLLCRVFRGRYTYHRASLVDKFSPSTGYWVIRKRA